jgi:hypothetical protein
VVLGDVQAVDAGLVGGSGEFKTLVERLRHRAVGGALDVIEYPNFHFFPPDFLGVVRGSGRTLHDPDGVGKTTETVYVCRGR